MSRRDAFTELRAADPVRGRDLRAPASDLVERVTTVGPDEGTEGTAGAPTEVVVHRSWRPVLVAAAALAVVAVAAVLLARVGGGADTSMTGPPESSGLDWTEVPISDEPGWVNDAVLDESGSLLVAGSSGHGTVPALWIEESDGRWEQTELPLPEYHFSGDVVDLSSVDGEVLAAGSAMNLSRQRPMVWYRSEEGWAASDVESSGDKFERVTALTWSDDGTLVAVGDGGGDANRSSGRRQLAWTSSDGGRTWDLAWLGPRSVDPLGTAMFNAAARAGDGSLVAVGTDTATGSSIWASRDGGITWSPLDGPAGLDLVSVSPAADGTLISTGADGSGEAVVVRLTSTGIVEASLAPSDRASDAVAVAGTSSGWLLGLQQSSAIAVSEYGPDATRTSSTLPCAGDCRLRGLAPAGELVIGAGSDGGKPVIWTAPKPSFVESTSTTMPPASVPAADEVSLDAAGSVAYSVLETTAGELVVAGSRNAPDPDLGLWSSPDGGVSWEAEAVVDASGTGQGGQIIRALTETSDGSVIGAGSSGVGLGIWRRDSDGSWTRQRDVPDDIPMGDAYGACTNPATGEIVVVGTDGLRAAVWLGDPSGTRWQRVQSEVLTSARGGASWAVSVACGPAGEYLVGGMEMFGAVEDGLDASYATLWYSEDGGQWERVEPPRGGAGSASVSVLRSGDAWVVGGTTRTQAGHVPVLWTSADAREWTAVLDPDGLPEGQPSASVLGLAETGSTLLTLDVFGELGAFTGGSIRSYDDGWSSLPTQLPDDRTGFDLIAEGDRMIVVGSVGSPFDPSSQGAAVWQVPLG